MFKKYFLIALVSGAVGFVAGNAFWYLASPLWIDRVVSEGFAGGASLQALSNGQFSDADAAHKGSGTVTAYETGDGDQILRFTDFEVTNGPDLKVWLVSTPDITDSDQVKSAKTLSLGPLKGNKGDQNYYLPPGSTLADWPSVVIWCEQFGVLFSAANLVTP